jgi:nucleoside-diphosphate-sugar epimerase
VTRAWQRHKADWNSPGIVTSTLEVFVMRVFVTGASGSIGSAVLPELLGAGHHVVGLARSDASAATIVELGGEVHRGDLEDLDGLRAAAERSDGVIHLGFVHDFSRYDDSVRIDAQAIETFGAVLNGSDRPFVIASGIAALRNGDAPATERDLPDPAFPRAPAAQRTVAMAEQHIRSSVIRLPPTVHGEGDHGFIPTLVNIARTTGVSGYIGTRPIVGPRCTSAMPQGSSALHWRVRRRDQCCTRLTTRECRPA